MKKKTITPQKDGAPILTYGIAESSFGLCFVGMIEQGISTLSFIEKKDIFRATPAKKSVDIIMEGTDFQLKVWEAEISSR